MTTHPPPTPLTKDQAEALIKEYGLAVSKRDRLHAEYMGKAMTDQTYDTFATLRDDTIPALRRRLVSALAATGTAQVPASAVELVNALLLEAEKFWWNDGPERKSAEPMNAAKRAVLEALASQGAAPAEARVYSDHLTLVAGQPLHVQAVIDAAWRHDPAALTESLTAAAFAEMKQRAGAAPTGAGGAEPAIGAWENDMGLVISAAQKQTMIDGGQASLSVSRSYTTPLYRAAPQQPAEAAPGDPLQGAADWLAQAHQRFSPAVLQSYLLIGYNRGKRLYDAAIATRKKPTT